MADEDKQLAMTASLTVFIDTSLDTHLLMLLSGNDTVSDFKRKIEKEHLLCFSDIGEIVVHALKVKRRGRFYFLSDSMLVKGAFGSADKNRFLGVDASAKKREEGRENARNLGSNNLLTCSGVLGNTTVDVVQVPLNGTSDPRKQREFPSERVEGENDTSRRDICEKHHVSVDEASQPDMAVKKRKRGIEQVVVDEEDLQGENIGSGKVTSKPAMISQTQLGDEERSGNGNLDGLTAIGIDDNHLATHDSDTHRRSKKRKKSKRNKTEDVPTSNKYALGDGYEASAGQKDSDELDAALKVENGKKLSESHGVSTKVGEQELPARDIRRITDESEKETPAANKTEASRDQLPADVESNPPLAMNKPDDLQMDVEVSAHNDIGNQQAERVEEQGELSNKNDLNRVQSNVLDSPRREETGVKRKDVDGAADLGFVNGSVVPTDTGKKSKRKKKTKYSVEKVLTTSAGGPEVQGSDINISAEPLGPKRGKERTDEKAGNEVANLSPKPKNGSEIVKENTESMVVAKEGAVNEVKTNENIEEPVDVEEEPVKKKSKRKQKSSATNLPEVQTETKYVVHENSTPPTVTKSKVTASSKTKKKDRSTKDHLNGGKLESDHSRVQNDSVPVEPKSVPAKSSTKAQSNSVDHRDKMSRGEPDLTGNPQSSGPTETNNQLKVSGEVLVDKKGLPDKAANTPKAGKNTKNSDTHSVQTSSNVQSSLKSNLKRGTPAGNSGTLFVQESVLKEKSDESMAPPGKKLPKALPTDMSAKTVEQNVVNGTEKNKTSGKNTDSLAAANSLSERPRNITSKGTASKAAADLKKSSNKDNSATVKSSGAQKRLLATPGAIFNGDSDASSDDEGKDGSDDSTKTPSDHSSDDSEGEESNANMKSPPKGSQTPDKTNSVDKRDILKSCSSSAKKRFYIR